MGVYLSDNALVIYSSVKDALTKFEGVYDKVDIYDGINEVFTDAMEDRIRRDESVKADIAETLNNLCALIDWVRLYCEAGGFLEKDEMENAIKMALFNFNLGEAPTNRVIFPKHAKDFVDRAEQDDPDEAVPFLPSRVRIKKNEKI